jgi:hypothetical protein
MGFHIVNNPLTLAVLRLAGANNGRRSRRSDFYYFLIFRGNLLAGYAESKRLSGMNRSALRHDAADPRSPWVYRGE